MDYLICCLCCLLCFACGVWAARGIPMPHRKQQQESWTQAEDTLSRDIAALLAYTGPGKEEDPHADT